MMKTPKEHLLYSMYIEQFLLENWENARNYKERTLLK